MSAKKFDQACEATIQWARSRINVEAETKEFIRGCFDEDVAHDVIRSHVQQIEKIILRTGGRQVDASVVRRYSSWVHDMTPGIEYPRHNGSRSSKSFLEWWGFYDLYMA